MSAPKIRIIETELCDDVRQSSPRKLAGSEDSRRFLQEFIGGRDREHFVVIHLDATHRIVSAEVVSVGVVDASPVHPREVFKAAILQNAASIICGHNHPSGSPVPSREDHEIFARLTSAGQLMGIPVLDFLVVTRDDYRSLTCR